jgi:hypothetical protein
MITGTLRVVINWTSAVGLEKRGPDKYVKKILNHF